MNMNKIGVALLAALAVMMIGAGAAQAAKFTPAKTPALINGSQNASNGTVFGFEDEKTASCETTGFAGEMTEASENLTVSSGYTNCTAFGFSEATISPNGCNFILHPGSGSSDSYTGTFDISCTESNKIVIVGGNCEVKIPAQNGLSAVKYSNLTASNPDEVEATFEVKTASGFTYEKTKDGSGCPLTGTGTKTTSGSLSGATSIKAGEKEGLGQFDFDIK